MNLNQPPGDLQNSQKKAYIGVFFKESYRVEACNFIEKETPAKVFSCEICESFKNALFIEHIKTTSFDQQTVWK